MPTYARRTTSQAGHETAQAARKATTRQHKTDDPAALLATSSAQAAMQARLAALAQGSGRAAQLRALQASADTRPLPEGMAAVQRFDGGEEEELPVQGRFADTAQRNGVEEEEPLQGRFTDTVQRSGPEEEEPLQGRFSAAPAQRQATGEESPAQMAKAPAPPNRSGLPDQLKAGIEALSGMSMDNVRVHYNSAKPAQLNALAYAQGTDIHMGPGQEQHLPHEAWHVVQQAQGRVRPTMQLQGTAVNDDAGLEKEADVMGHRATANNAQEQPQQMKTPATPPITPISWSTAVVQNALPLGKAEEEMLQRRFTSSPAQCLVESDSVVRNRVADERVAGVATQRVAGFARSGEFTPQFVKNRPESPLQMKPQGVASQFVTNRTATGLRQSLYKAAYNGTGLVQRSLMSRIRWSAYVTGLPNNQVTCDAIDTAEARTTLQEVRNGNGDITNRFIRLHTWTDNAWREIGSVTIERSPMGAMQGPLLPNAAALPGPGYDDRELILHTAAAGGAGNAGVATHLFPAVLRWINFRLHGVQQINMNPAGGAASKSVIADLGARLGNGADHANANTAREARQTAAAAAAVAAAGGGPAVVAIGSGAGANALNTWDTRLNEEHLHDLASLNAAPLAGLSVGADGMTLAGPAAQADIPAMRAQRDFFRDTMNGADPVINAEHPNAAYFQAAAALTDDAIDAEPRTAAMMLRMARLTSRSGVLGTGGGLDAGYQITLGGAALARLMPQATGN